MKFWINNVGPTLDGYIWCKSIDEAKEQIEDIEKEQQYFYNLALNSFHYGKNDAFHKLILMCERRKIEVIDINRDSGDYIHFLDWLEKTGRNYPIHIHSMNNKKRY